ncbi:2,4-dienoyl-CoA reductase-like NADH-dependent reductase (Old Yellow Enzyme family) [Filimonas zeae]|uniref:NADH-dependent flavin oxidoreductase n=1 Tax=Filimonas zeae TaxID=1737353 RepID=A0A917MU32_9BACT|nr:NADH-dependent flavin oxidoreductase [Filimonas zeae]MDR6339375.1 2,4-dienoyl-CoA reductase-like NADH-dependent reductase (Old Yellow Enzyme family) [Filimonas zeae]GGH63881.1 NADH-dependent flavin oxidoreductase [Filimonas zeae]
MNRYKKLLAPLTFNNGIQIQNRIVMAPMTTWAGNDDFTVSDEEIAWYRERVNGVGMVITGCTHVTPEGIGFTNEFAAYDDRFLPGLKKLAAVAKSGGAPAILQIFHAGHKGIPNLSPGGVVVSASDVKSEITPFSAPDLIAPRPLEEKEIWQIIKAFGTATRRAIEAGFDGVEIHGAHGFLNQNFLSPMINKRKDAWGGSIENRLRFSKEVVREIRRVIALYADKPFITGFRISPEESASEGLRLTDSLTLVDMLIQEQVDYLHFSLFHVLQQQPLDSNTSKTITQVITAYVNNRIPVIAAGQITTPAQAEQAIAAGLDMVALGRALLINPRWAKWVGEGQEDKITMVLDADTAAEKHIPGNMMAYVHKVKGWVATVEKQLV